MFFEILRNISIVLAFCSVYSLLFRGQKPGSLAGRCLIGLVFGLAAVFAMLTPALFDDVDSRSVFLSMAGLFGGGAAVIISGAIALLCRALLGGPGAPIGYGIILTSVGIGMAYHRLRRGRDERISNLHFWLFGMLVHLVMVAMFWFLPADIRWEVVDKAVWPVLLIYPVATLLLGRLLSLQNEQTHSRELIRQSEEKYRTFFENSSDAMLIIEGDHFVDCNAATAELLGYSSRQELLNTHPSELSPEFQPDGSKSYEKAEEIMALARKEGGHRFEWVHRRKDGSLIPIDVSLTAMEGKSGILLHTVWRDLTERNAAAQALSESEEKYRGLVESSSDWIWEIDERDRFTYASPQVEHMLGYAPTELIGMSPFDLMAPSEAKRVTQIFAGLKAHAEPLVGIVNVNLHKDGREVILETSGVPVMSPDGQVVGYRGVDRDITKRKRAEDELRESVQKLTLHVNQTPLGVIGWNTAFEVVEWNPAAEKIFGYTREEAIGQHAMFIVPDVAREQANKIWRQLLANEGGFRGTNDNLMKSGEHITCEWYNTPLVDAAGQVIGVSSLVMNITARQRAEGERARLTAAIEQAEEVIVITDADAVIQYVNPAFERVTGYSSAEVLGQKPCILKSGRHSSEFYRAMWDTLTSGEPWSGHFINKKKDGAIYTEKAAISPVFDAAGRVVNYVAAKHDVTHELELEDQLRHAQKMEAIGQLAGGIAHDFNNLLQVIGGYAELSLMDVDQEAPCFSALSEIQEASLRGKQLVSQLLAFSRRQILKPEDINLNHVIDTLLKMIRGLIGEHIALEFIPGHNLAAIHADHSLMEQVLINLCVNARDAMPDGGKITIETENMLIDDDYAALHTWSTPGRYVLLNIADNGCGMDSRTLEHIFEPFFTTKEIGQGTGLGLSTVFGIVKQHDGHVNVYSELEKGTVFKIYLPAVERKATPISRAAPEPVSGGKETILVAEDDETVLLLAKHLLTEAGYTVLTACDGEEAVRVFEQHVDDVDCVLLDVVMPRLGGKQALERILNVRPVPHLFASGYSENAAHTSFIQNRGHHLLNKPYQAESLLRKVREVLDEANA